METLANWVAAKKPAAGQRLADQRDQRYACAIALVEQPAAAERHA